MRAALPSMARDPAEQGRGSTPLELFFDLTFVVAVAQVASSLHHGLVEGDVSESVFGFLFCFFAILWPWVNFTWFASAYDVDDVPYRLATFVQMAGVLVLAAVELTIPVWAEGPHRTPWHPGHIAERYGLFTIIVLGESLLAATIGVQVALDGDVPLADLLAVIVGGLLVVFSMWWVYFDMPAEVALERARRDSDGDHLSTAYAWSYGHYVVFAAIAAAGAGIAVAIDQVADHSQLSDVEAGLALTLPVCAYLIGVWVLHARHKRRSFMNSYGVPLAVAVILALSFTAEPVLLTGMALAGVVAVAVWTRSGELRPDVV